MIIIFVLCPQEVKPIQTCCVGWISWSRAGLRTLCHHYSSVISWFQLAWYYFQIVKVKRCCATPVHYIFSICSSVLLMCVINLLLQPLSCHWLFITQVQSLQVCRAMKKFIRGEKGQILQLNTIYVQLLCWYLSLSLCTSSCVCCWDITPIIQHYGWFALIDTKSLDLSI